MVGWIWFWLKDCINLFLGFIAIKFIFASFVIRRWLSTLCSNHCIIQSWYHHGIIMVLPWYCHGICALWFGDYNSANVCSCACRKSRLIKGYELSYATGSLNAGPSCIQWGVWVWIVGHWVVPIQVIYCQKTDELFFFKRTNGIPERCSWVAAIVVSPIFQ